jgi:bacillithiol system protein YtxJ
MKWKQLNQISQLTEIDSLSFEHPVLLFKHSTRCSISSSALARIERHWQESDDKNLEPYFLDLLSHRPISNEIAKHYGIEHQSPQALIIKNGKCVYHASHLEIHYDVVLKSAAIQA